MPREAAIPMATGPFFLDARDPSFGAAFDAVAEGTRDTPAAVDGAVTGIIAAIRRDGDAALVDFTKRFDRFDCAIDELAIGADEVAAAVAACPAAQLDALKLAAARIEVYHRRQLPQDSDWVDGAGVRLGAKWTAISAAGLYIPGGTASYPSSVLMNAIPAKVAGVERIVMVVPTPDGILNPLVLAAASFAGITEIYRVGGAQAVAALAYGTETIHPVDKIVGPGNAYVAAAKRQVFGRVGIDTIAGPSEILVMADAGNDPAWIAADLLSQAEHDSDAQSILITDDAEFARRVVTEVERQLALLPRRGFAETSWRTHGLVIVVNGFADAIPMVDRLAPEHLELALADPDPIARRIRNAGAIFLGRWTPEAIGDYVAGPNHVLPTARTARYASGLGVLDFMKRTSLVACDAASLAEIGPAAVMLAEAEGLDAHARSVSIRMNRRGERG